MSYNGIGLSTPRGSATSGFIQRNLSSVKKREPYSVSQATSIPHLQRHRVADVSILQHEARRKLANDVLIYRTKLESDSSISQEELERRVAQYKSTREAEVLGGHGISVKKETQHKAHQTHEITVAKEAELSAFRSAIGIRKDYVEGTATKSKENNARDEPYDPVKEVFRNPLDRRARMGNKRHRFASRSPRQRRSYTPPVRRRGNRTRSRSPPPRRQQRRDMQSPSQPRDEAADDTVIVETLIIRPIIKEEPQLPELIFDRRKALGID